MVVDTVPLADAAVREHLTEWFNQYNLALFRYLVRLLGDEEQAADLLQETFAGRWSHCATTNCPPTHMRGSVGSAEIS